MVEKEDERVKVRLIDVDGHNFPNLALMKLSAYHKAQGDSVGMYTHDAQDWADRVYMAKVFTFTEDYPRAVYGDETIKGGTGYFYPDGGMCLPDEAEHSMPDYALYRATDTAYGFLTRGCPRGCGFCIVAHKEGRKSYKVANLSEFWAGQPNISLMDPNILACRDHLDLLGQLADSRAMVDFNQGLDIRLTAPENIEILNRTRVKRIHFAWDNPKDDLTGYFKRFTELYKRKSSSTKCVYVLTNYDSTFEEDLFRIYTLRDLGYDPYVMVFEKWSAPKQIKQLQRWVNAKPAFRSCRKFEDYNASIKNTNGFDF